MKGKFRIPRTRDPRLLASLHTRTRAHTGAQLAYVHTQRYVSTQWRKRPRGHWGGEGRGVVPSSINSSRSASDDHRFCLGIDPSALHHLCTPLLTFSLVPPSRFSYSRYRPSLPVDLWPPKHTHTHVQSQTKTHVRNRYTESIDKRHVANNLFSPIKLKLELPQLRVLGYTMKFRRLNNFCSLEQRVRRVRTQRFVIPENRSIYRSFRERGLIISHSNRTERP